MIKYVLNSGGTRNNPEEGKKFFAECLKGLGDKPKLLICRFAQPREDWEKKIAEDEERTHLLFPKEVHPMITLALPEIFEQQVKDSDIIYIHGGDDHLIQYWFKKFNIPKIWEGKVVATNSASSHVLSKHFWTCDWRQCMDGLGILPIKFIAHYKSSYGNDDPRGQIDWDKAYKELADHGDKTLPIYALKEGEFVVFEI